MTAIEVLQEELIEVKKKMEECYDFLQSDPSDENKKKLEKIYTKLEVKMDRMSIGLDVLSGRAFLIHEHKDELSVIKPSEKTAKLVKAAVEYGGKVTKYEEQMKL